MAHLSGQPPPEGEYECRLFIEILRQVEPIGLTANVCQTCLSGFLHDIAKLSRKDQFPLPLQHSDLCRQNRSADLRPGHAGDYADLRLAGCFRIQNFGFPTKSVRFFC